MTFEYRSIDLSTWAVDDATDTAPPMFRGSAIVYNSRTAIGDPKTWGFWEEIAPGAVSRSLSEDDQVLLVNHDTSMVVSRRSAGTLQLDDQGDRLSVSSVLDDDLSYARDLRANVRNGNIRGMSFGFNIRKGGVETSELDDGSMLMRVTDLQLMEVSAVTFPAYSATDASLRSSPLLTRRQAEWVDPSAESEVVQAARYAYRMRYLASRYQLPMTAKGE